MVVFQEIVIGFGIQLGRSIAKLHYNGIMHGDLTTSNILLRNRKPEMIVFIDFGLSEVIFFSFVYSHVVPTLVKIFKVYCHN